MPPLRICLGLVVLLLVAAGCSAREPSADSAPSGARTPPASGEALGENAWLAVTDTFVACVQRDESLGLSVRYRDGRAVSETEGVGGATYADELSAPQTIGDLVEGGKAQYVGIRKDTRNEVGDVDIDVLIFRAEGDAVAAADALGDESGSRVDPLGLIVFVPLGTSPNDFGPLGDCRDEAAAAIPR